MPPKKRVPFNGDDRAADDAAFVADHLRRYGKALADLDALRSWARQGQGLLAQALSALSRQVAALEQSNDPNAGPGAEHAHLAASIELMVPAMYVRESLDPMQLVAALKNAHTFVGELLAELPAPAKMGGQDAADEFLRLTHTREEVAKSLNVTVESIETRRKRRR